VSSPTTYVRTYGTGGTAAGDALAAHPQERTAALPCRATRPHSKYSGVHAYVYSVYLFIILGKCPCVTTETYHIIVKYSYAATEPRVYNFDSTSPFLG
jgi:hypothetical protein